MTGTHDAIEPPGSSDQVLQPINGIFPFDDHLKCIQWVCEAMERFRNDQSLIPSLLSSNDHNQVTITLELLWQIQRYESFVGLISRAVHRHQRKKAPKSVKSPPPLASREKNSKNQTKHKRRIHLAQLSVMWMKIHCLQVIHTDIASFGTHPHQFSATQAILNIYFGLSPCDYHRTTRRPYLSRLLGTPSGTVAYVEAAEALRKIWMNLTKSHVPQPSDGPLLNVSPDLLVEVRQVAKSLEVFTETTSAFTELTNSCAECLIKQTIDWARYAYQDALELAKQVSLLRPPPPISDPVDSNIGESADNCQFSRHHDPRFFSKAPISDPVDSNIGESADNSADNSQFSQHHDPRFFIEAPISDPVDSNIGESADNSADNSQFSRHRDPRLVSKISAPKSLENSSHSTAIPAHLPISQIHLPEPKNTNQPNEDTPVVTLDASHETTDDQLSSNLTPDTQQPVESNPPTDNHIKCIPFPTSTIPPIGDPSTLPFNNTTNRESRVSHSQKDLVPHSHRLLSSANEVIEEQCQSSELQNDQESPTFCKEKKQNSTNEELTTTLVGPQELPSSAQQTNGYLPSEKDSSKNHTVALVTQIVESLPVNHEPLSCQQEICSNEKSLLPSPQKNILEETRSPSSHRPLEDTGSPSLHLPRDESTLHQEETTQNSGQLGEEVSLSSLQEKLDPETHKSALPEKEILQNNIPEGMACLSCPMEEFVPASHESKLPEKGIDATIHISQLPVPNQQRDPSSDQEYSLSQENNDYLSNLEPLSHPQKTCSHEKLILPQPKETSTNVEYLSLHPQSPGPFQQDDISSNQGSISSPQSFHSRNSFLCMPIARSKAASPTIQSSNGENRSQNQLMEPESGNLSQCVRHSMGPQTIRNDAQMMKTATISRIAKRRCRSTEGLTQRCQKQMKLNSIDEEFPINAKVTTKLIEKFEKNPRLSAVFRQAKEKAFMRKSQIHNQEVDLDQGSEVSMHSDHESLQLPTNDPCQENQKDPVDDEDNVQELDSTTLQKLKDNAAKFSTEKSFFATMMNRYFRNK